MSFARYLAEDLADNLTFFGPTDGPYSVRVNQNQLSNFASKWPMSRSQDLNAFEAEFASNGDLIDYKCFMPATPYGFSSVAMDCDDAVGMDFDLSGEAKALIDDMQCGAALAGLVKLDHCKDLDQFMGDY